MKLSVVSPVYKAGNIIDELIKRIENAVSPITADYEIILVEDCGGDNSWEKITAHCRRDSRVKGIKLSRNFGQHHAITAGIDHCKGDWVVVMDCDLQDQPEEIPKLYAEAQKGFDIVYARRFQRTDSFLKKATSKLFYRIFAWLSGIPQDGTIANFGIYSAKAIKAVVTMREPLRAFFTMIKWVGFPSTSINVEHAPRFAGKSSYNWKRLYNFALDISLSFSDKPLRLTVKLGVIIATSAMLFGFYNVYKYYTGSITQAGYASIIVSIWFLSGLIIFILGIIGLYLSKVFEGVKNRPLYLIESRIND